MRRHAIGFTILELSIVLVIIALVTGMGLLATLGAIESARRSATLNKLDAIEKALMDYRQIRNRLPCPSSLTLTSASASYGAELCTGNFNAANEIGIEYSAIEGGIPVQELKLPYEFMYDGWGRRFMYSVAYGATFSNAFSSISPSDYCDISVLDATGANRLAMATDSTKTAGIYALVSFGPNGYGGYLPNGTRMTVPTDTSEKLNCHCAAPTATYTPQYVDMDVTGTFDDIVRYKARWQMQTEMDDFTFANYYSPWLTMSFLGSGAIYYSAAYTRSCNTWRAYAPTGLYGFSDLEFTRYVFTADKKYLIAYGDTAASNNCKVLNSTPPFAQVAQFNCAAFNATDTKMVISDNGYLATIRSDSINFDLWKIGSDGAATYLPSPLTDPGAAPKIVAFSKDTQFLLLSDGDGTTTNYLNLYKRNLDNTFTVLTPPNVSNLASGVTGAAAFSPDGKYLAISGIESPGKLYIWKRNSNWPWDGTSTAFSSLTQPSAPSKTLAVKFSPDGFYLAALGSEEGTGVANLYVYKIDGNDVFTRVTNLTGLANDNGVGNDFIAKDLLFTADSTYLWAFANPSATGFNKTDYPLFLLRKTSPTDFVSLSVPQTEHPITDLDATANTNWPSYTTVPLVSGAMSSR